MGTINYKVTSGVFPITVELIGTGGTVTNIHNAYENGVFVDVPSGAYTIRFTDDSLVTCLYEELIDICTECWEGYTALTDQCIRYIEQVPIYDTTTLTIIAAEQSSAYSLNGTVIFSSWNYNGTGIYERITPSSNTYWANTPYPSLTGPMNRSAIWANNTLDNQDIAVSFCIEIAIGKFYYIGVSADNTVKLKLNGEFILDQDKAAIMAMFGSSDISIIQKNWFIYPVFFPAGKNVLEVFGHNETGLAALGVEIYDATKQDLIAADSDLDLGTKLLFRSSSLAGNSLSYEYSTLQGYHGYHCNTGFALNTCDTIAVCVQRDTMTCAEASTTTSTTTTSTTSTSTSTTTSTTTTSTTTFPTYSACSVFNIHFESYLNNQIGFITAGNVIATGHTVGDYVIEWRLNSYDGPNILITGNRLLAAPDVSVAHPLVNIPVVEGTICPVIRFIDINGYRYGISQSDERYAPDLKECLYPPLVVQSYTCNNGGTGIYSHSLTYNNLTQVSSDASKTITIDLNSDGSTGFLAWKFSGFTVSDEIEFFYVTGEVETRIQYFVIGQDLATKLGIYTNYTTTPKTNYDHWYRGVIKLTDDIYTLGDYIKVKITPSYADPSNENTNWQLEFKCLPANAFDQPMLNPLWQQIDPCSFVATFDLATCRMNVRWNQLGALTSPAITYFQNYINAGLYGQWGVESNAGSVSAQYLRFNETAANYTSGLLCHDYLDNVTIVKSGGVGGTLTYSFLNVTDYNWFKDRYLSMRNSLMSGYSADPTNINYYRQIMLMQDVSVKCGDSFTRKNINHHVSTPYTFNDVDLTFTANPVLVTNQYVDTLCSNVYETISSYIYSMNSAYNLANQTLVTKVGNFYSPGWIVAETANDIDVLRWCVLVMDNDNMLEVYGGYDAGYCSDIYQTQIKQYYKYYLRFKVTDVLNPTQNYEVYNTLVNGCYSATNQTLIYKIVNGVRIVPSTC